MSAGSASATCRSFSTPPARKSSAPVPPVLFTSVPAAPVASAVPAGPGLADQTATVKCPPDRVFPVLGSRVPRPAPAGVPGRLRPEAGGQEVDQSPDPCRCRPSRRHHDMESALLQRIVGQNYLELARRDGGRGDEGRKDDHAEAGTGGFAQELAIVGSQPRRAAHIFPAPADLEPPLIASARIGIEEEVVRSEEHTSELQSLMRISYAGFCSK